MTTRLARTERERIVHQAGSTAAEWTLRDVRQDVARSERDGEAPRLSLRATFDRHLWDAVFDACGDVLGGVRSEDLSARNRARVHAVARTVARDRLAKFNARGERVAR
jgi:hypothetical protein